MVGTANTSSLAAAVLKLFDGLSIILKVCGQILIKPMVLWLKIDRRGLEKNSIKILKTI